MKSFLLLRKHQRGFNAHALGASIFTEAEDIANLYAQIRDAVLCHFDKGEAPSIIRLQFVREEVIAL